MIKMTVIMVMTPQSVIFQIHQRLEGANAASLSRPPWNPSPWTKGIYLFLLLNVWEKGYNQCQILYETNVYRETYVKCTWTEIGCKWNVFASSLFLSMITMIFSVLIAMIWWWCWLQWFDGDVDCDDVMMMLVVVMSSEQRLPLVRLPWIFPFLFQPTLHTNSICMDGDDYDHHDNHLYFDDQWWQW